MAKPKRQPVSAKGGRPAHEPTDKDQRIVETLAGVGLPHVEIAKLIGITAPTLREHYREALDRGAAGVEAKLVNVLLSNATGKDVRPADQNKAAMFVLERRFSERWHAPAAEAAPGKKEQRKAAAEQATSRFAVPAPPRPPQSLN